MQKCATDGPPLQGNHFLLSGSQPAHTHEEDVVQVCCSSGCCYVHHASASLDPKSVITPFLELLRSELHHLFAAHMEEVVRPLRGEVSSIKLWLARISNHLERAELNGEHLSASNIAELFGPCSPVKLSPKPMMFASLAEECMSVDSQVCEGISDTITNETVPSAQTVETPSVEIHEEKAFGMDEKTTITSFTEPPQEMPVQQFAAMTGITCTSQEPSEELKLLEDADKLEVLL